MKDDLRVSRKWCPAAQGLVSPAVEVTSASREPGGARLIGRDDELGRLRALVDPVPAGSRLLVVRGDAGMGKTALLADLARRAADAGMRVLPVTGQKSEDTLAFAGLHQLLRPVLVGTSRLPEPQAIAILAVLGLTPDPAAPDRLLTGTAVLNLLAELSAPSGVLVVADDAHWLDRSSLDVLAFASRRLGAERIALVLGVRGNAALPGFDHDVEELRLRPLPAGDASRLLDQQLLPPRGRARQQVLSQAAGNPMALIELSSAIAADPASRRWDVEPLPLTDRLTAVIIAELAALPAATRHALLLASVADRGDGAAATALSGLEPGVLVPAEELGLVTVGTAGVRFSHPLVRSAVYHGAPFASRSAAHLAVAAKLGHDQLDQRAWHLAAAALHPDERVASLLAATASQAQYRGGAGTAALALERAAELSPDPEMQGQRLVSAATIAIPTGQADWIRDLATRALAVTAVPELRIRARRAVGWALAWSGRHAAALPELISVAEEASASLTLLAWETLAIAASVAYQCGAPTALRRVEKTLGVLEQAGPPSGDSPCREVDALRLWIQASIGACGDRSETARRLDPANRRAPGSALALPSGIGGVGPRSTTGGNRAAASRQARNPGLCRPQCERRVDSSARMGLHRRWPLGRRAFVRGRGRRCRQSPAGSRLDVRRPDQWHRHGGTGRHRGSPDPHPQGAGPRSGTEPVGDGTSPACPRPRRPGRRRPYQSVWSASAAVHR